ncbi:MAG: L,D-transpeptidase, partial [Verrucomicrobia bacterium]|nr:L,D-transpeptidase [Verrucomicrobiota bacterium]
ANEDRIGTPDSHGCVRMRNADIAVLFDLVEVGTPIFIG